MKGTKNGVSLELSGSVWGIGEEKWRKKKEKEKIKIKMGVGICGSLEVWCWENRNGWRKKRKKKNMKEPATALEVGVGGKPNKSGK